MMLRGGGKNDEAAGIKLRRLVEDVKEDSEIKCRLEMVVGNREKAVSYLLEASHFITNRTYNTVYMTCLADRLGIEIISGVDANIVLKTDGYNIIREADE